MHTKFEWPTIPYIMINARLHTTNTTHNKTKHQHHELPRPPASSGFSFIGKCDPGILLDQTQSTQHSYVIFIDETNEFFILSTIILQASDQRAC